MDYSRAAIERGRTLVSRLGLEEVVQLDCADIREGAVWTGEYDYIAAHGVYSWVPPDVRQALLAGIGRTLAPDGVAFVSYLAHPGAHLREMLRQMLQFHTHRAPDAEARIGQARAFMGLLANGATDESPYRAALVGQIKSLANRSGEALFHDELSSESHAFLLTEFVGAAGEHGLDFLGEAEYVVPAAQHLTEAAIEHLRPLSSNRVLLEQYLDFMEGRRFRQTLLCRAGRGIELVAERLDSLHLTFRARPAPNTNTDLMAPEPLEAATSGRTSLEARSPVEKAATLELAGRDRSMRFPALAEAVRERLAAAGVAEDPGMLDHLRHFLIRAALPKLLDVTRDEPARAIALPSKPRVSTLARWQVAQHAPIVFTLGGDGVALQDELSRHLLRLLDGTRDEAALFDELARFAAAQADAPAVRAILESGTSLDVLLRRSLEGLTALGLVYRDS